MVEHIGIVGCSAEGASLCYRTICQEAPDVLGPHAHPEITMHTPSLADYVACLERGDMEGVAALMNQSAMVLHRAGADFLICPDNTIHQDFDRMEPNSPLPWLHIARVTATQAVDRGFRRLGVLGTKWLVDSDVYPDALAPLGIEVMRPSPEDRDLVDRIIMTELVPGIVRQESTEAILSVIERLRTGGADAVILGCTELPIVVSDANAAVPTLDTTRLLARAALKKAVAKHSAKPAASSANA